MFVNKRLFTFLSLWNTTYRDTLGRSLLQPHWKSVAFKIHAIILLYFIDRSIFDVSKKNFSIAIFVHLATVLKQFTSALHIITIGIYHYKRHINYRRFSFLVSTQEITFFIVFSQIEIIIIIVYYGTRA